MRTILVTGGAGFIGSNFVRFMLQKHRGCRIVNLDALTYAGNMENLKAAEGNPNHIFIKADIRDKEAVENVFRTFEVNSVINFAAESHVDRSIDFPEKFFSTNVMGTLVLLEASRRYWKEGGSKAKFVQVSTDEVYGALGEKGKFTEGSPLMPNSPYSASKAGADMAVRAYHETYGLPVNITRCSNNYGPYQFPEKLIPLMISNCIEGKELPVYGDGMQIRDWLHVSDHCSAIDAVLQKGADGEVYNVGGNNESANIDLVRLIVSTLGKPETLIKHVKDRPGHDRRYAIDNTKITEQLGWKPAYSFEKGIKETIEWYINNRDWIEHIATGLYRESAK